MDLKKIEALLKSSNIEDNVLGMELLSQHTPIEEIKKLAQNCNHIFHRSIEDTIVLAISKTQHVVLHKNSFFYYGDSTDLSRDDRYTWIKYKIFHKNFKL